MKKLLKPANIAFYILMLLVFFAIGLYVAGLLEVGKNQGLAGGAIVFGYGVLFGGIAFIASFFITYHLKHKLIVRFNWILLLLLILAYGITHYRYLERQNKHEQQDFKKTPTTEAKTEPTAMHYQHLKKEKVSEEQKMGIGFFTPNFHENSTLFFYGGVNLEKGLTEHMPQDSMVFALDQYKNFTTTYAPPWLLPAQLKLDYGIMHLKVLGMGRELVKVETNSKTNRISYADKQAGTFVSWPEYILSMNSVELIMKTNQKVHIKPLDNAGEVQADFDFITPLLVEGDWLYGLLLTDNRTETGKGWVRWRKDGKLLITYSLFS